MTEGFVLNLLADTAAGEAASGTMLLNSDRVAHEARMVDQMCRVAKRLAVIELECWDKCKLMSHEKGTDSRAAGTQQGENSKAEMIQEAIDNTAGASHSLVRDGSWVHCRYCPAHARKTTCITGGRCHAGRSTREQGFWAQLDGTTSQHLA